MLQRAARAIRSDGTVGDATGGDVAWAGNGDVTAIGSPGITPAFATGARALD
jgi:hypothetical protein